jgi:hypothetical protein
MVVVGCQRDEGRCVAHHRLAHLSYVGAAVKVAHTAAVKVAHRGAERSAVRSADGAAHDGLSERGRSVIWKRWRWRSTGKPVRESLRGDF